MSKDEMMAELAKGLIDVLEGYANKATTTDTTTTDTITTETTTPKPNLHPNGRVRANPAYFSDIYTEAAKNITEGNLHIVRYSDSPYYDSKSNIYDVILNALCVAADISENGW